MLLPFSLLSSGPVEDTLTLNARRSLMTERSERMSEEASFHLNLHHARSHGATFEQTTENSSEYGQVHTGAVLVASRET